jgi:lipopolysaccharide transport system ATP-binding protein
LAGMIEARDLGRRYRHGVAESGPLTWKKLLSKRGRRGDLLPVWALRHLDFDVHTGQSLGLVGPNGAGKSTLLKLIGAIGLPDEGQLRVRGRVAALFELGQDFHPDLTGRDNIRTAGLIAGFARREVQRRLPDVIEFAGLGPFIDSPLRVYSSGMKARLAFAVAIHNEPDILLVDEVLAVGDVGFQRRCAERIGTLRAAGVTIVVASHSVDEVRSLCDEVMWLRGGRVVATGPPDQVLQRYTEATTQETRLLTPAPAQAGTPRDSHLGLHENRFGTQEATIDSFRILDSRGQERAEFPTEAALHLEIVGSVPVALQPVNISVRVIRRRDGVGCLDSSTRVMSTSAEIRVTADIERVDLAPGDYGVDVGLYSHDWDRTLDFHTGAYSLKVVGAGPTDAIWAPPVGWAVRDARARDGPFGF